MQEAFNKIIDSISLPTETRNQNYLKLYKKQFQIQIGIEENLKILSNEERIKLFYNNFEWISFSKDDLSKYKKSGELSTKFREQGNLFYKDNQIQDALYFYNLAIAYATLISKEFCLALANRSAIYYYLKKPKEAIEDIDLSILNGYEFREKIEERKFKCQKLQESLNNQKVTCSNKKQEEEDFITKDLFKLKSFNHDISSAEDFVQIQRNDIKGRFLIVTRDVSPGEVLIVETPLEKVLLKEYDFDFEHCHYCHKKRVRLISCPNCIFAHYCNEYCLSKAKETFHRYECQISSELQVFGLTRNVLLSFRLITGNGPKILKKYFDNPNLLNLDIEEYYNSNDYRTIYNLISHPEKLSNYEITSYSLTAITLTELLFRFTSFFEHFSLIEFKSFISTLILNHIQNLPCNAHSLIELNLDNPNDIESVQRATSEEYSCGSFSLLSLINHSCDPNVFRVNTEDQVSVVAIKYIKSGEEINDNYGPHFALESSKVRKEHLLRNYYFDCLCPPCIYDWPNFNLLEKLELKFKCTNCYLNKGIDQEIHNKLKSCSSCGDKIVFSKKKLQLEEIDKQFNSCYESVLKCNQLFDCLTILRNILKFYELNIIFPCSKINHAQETLKHCLNLMIDLQYKKKNKD